MQWHLLAQKWIHPTSHGSGSGSGRKTVDSIHDNCYVKVKPESYMG